MKVAGQIGLGTYRLGPKTEAVCAEALALGYRHIDTARLYRNEDAVRRAVEASGLSRKDISLATKIRLEDIESGRVRDAALESRDRLGRVDLLLLHAPGSAPARAWEDLVRVQQDAPEIRAIGVSNFARFHLRALISPYPSVNQIEVSPFLTRPALCSECERLGIRVEAHSPLTKGRKLSNARLKAIAADVGATPAQVMIAWGLSQGFRVLPRASTSSHLLENLRAADLNLTSEAMAALSQLDEGFSTHPQHVGGDVAPLVSDDNQSLR